MSSPMTTSSDVAYRDVQYPRTPIVLGLLSVAGVAVAVGAVYATVGTLLTAILGLALLGATAQRARLVVEVTGSAVRVGPAHIEWAWVRRVEVLEGAAMRAALTTDAHPLDHIDIRRSAAGLRLWLADPSDPHRCWLTSVADPAALRSTLRSLDLPGVDHDA